MFLDRQDIELIKEYLADKPVKKAYLFGSYADGSADQESDIDLLLELDYSKHIGLNFVLMKDDLEKALHRKIDMISAGAVSRFISPFIEKQKRLIYER